MSEPVFVFISSFNVAQCIEQLRGLSGPLRWMKTEHFDDEKAGVLLAADAPFLGLFLFIPRNYAIIALKALTERAVEVSVTLFQRRWSIGATRWLPNEIALQLNATLQSFKLESLLSSERQGFVSPYSPDACIASLRPHTFKKTYRDWSHGEALALSENDDLINSIVSDYSVGSDGRPWYQLKLFLTFYPLEGGGSFVEYLMEPKRDRLWMGSLFLFGPFLVVVGLAVWQKQYLIAAAMLLVAYGMVRLNKWQNRRPHLTRTQLLASVKQWLDATVIA